MKTVTWLKTVSLSIAVLLTLAGCAGNDTQRSTGQYVDDKTISTRVKTALISDKEVKAGNIDVETYKGVVALSGFVESKSEAERALTLARNVNGVKSVKDDMHIRQ
jgi:osmotically-inducible protein OsmY